MFKFNYLIYDNVKKELSEISFQDFEKDYGSIYGAFELIINDRYYNYIVRYENQDFKDLYEKRKFEDTFGFQDILSVWIPGFIEISIDLITKNYVGFRDIESLNWLEFNKVNDILYISQIEEEKVYPDLNALKVYEKFYEDDKNKDIDVFLKKNQ